jgi:hypothetical protein
MLRSVRSQLSLDSSAGHLSACSLLALRILVPLSNLDQGHIDLVISNLAGLELCLLWVQ